MDRTLIDTVEKSFKKGKSIRRNLPLNGKVVIDQKLPYLCVYRFRSKPDVHILSLLKTQGTYLFAEESVEISSVLEKLTKIGMREFRAFMIVEIWKETQMGEESTFKVLHPEGKVSAPIHALEKGLKALSQFLPSTKVKLEGTFQRHPDGFKQLISLHELKESGALLIGMTIPAIFADKEDMYSYPLFFRKIKRTFGALIKVAAFELIRGQSNSKFANYLMLGKTRLDFMARSADKRISAIDERMNFILTVTPINVASEWERFKENNFSKTPKFTYRLIPIDPEIEKRELFNIPLERVEDPTLAFLLRDKRTELEKQLQMLEERGSKKFFHLSQSVYGDVDEDTLEAAISLLNYEIPGEQVEYNSVNAFEFAKAAKLELEKYKEAFPFLDLQVTVKESVTGLLVSGPELSVGHTLSVSEERVNPLIQHEIGTHILTYCNGKAQPLGLMYTGFAGYDQLQEGIAVLSEFLVGGLNINRLRLLAARVLAVNALIHGADFIETFNLLKNEHGFGSTTAFNITMRVFRGGGYTKDAIYLKGLIQVLGFIKKGGDLTQLYAGKYALEHLPLIQELMHLNILKKPVLPDYLLSDEAKQKIERIKNGISLAELTI